MSFNDYLTAEHIVQKSFKDKKDLAGKPYIDHLYFVAEPFKDETKIIALLHDILEDCPEWTPKALTCFFTEALVEAVVALTKNPEDEYEDYIDRIKKFSQSGAFYGPVVKRVKLRDLEHNMQVHRLPILEEKEIMRLGKYHWAYEYLKS